MHEIANFYHHQGAQPQTHHDPAGALRQEIAYMEARLQEMGHNGDCAYERAMAQTFRTLLESRRRELAALR